MAAQPEHGSNGDKMRIALWIDKSVALRAGKGVWGTRIVDVDPATLTPTQRDTLAHRAFCATDDKGLADKDGIDFYLLPENFARYSYGMLNATFQLHPEVISKLAVEPTAEAILSILDAAPAAVEAERHRLDVVRAENDRKQEERHAKHMADLHAKWDGRSVEALIYRQNGGIVGHAWDVVCSRELREVGRLPEAEAEAKRRNAAELAEQEDSRHREFVACVAMEVAKTDQRRAWVQEHGTDDQRERLEAGLLSRAEVEDAIRAEAMAPIAHWRSYDPIHKQDVCVCGEDSCRLSVEVETATELNADQWQHLKLIRSLMPHATVTPRLHVATMDECAEGLERLSLRVLVQVGAYIFTRELSC